MISSTWNPRLAELDSGCLQGLGRDPVALADKAEQDVLGAEMAVAEQLGFFLRKHDDLPRPGGKALKHRFAPKVAVSGAGRRPR